MTFDVTTLTGLHTVLSLVALAAGIVVILGLAFGRDLPGWTLLFLATAIATSATGFLSPAPGLLPSHIFGVVSLVALGVAILARFRHGYAGRWRVAFVLCVVLATWLDAFVAVVQVFLKVPAANALAPTQAEPPFAIAQAVTLGVFVVLAVLAVRRFRPPG